VDVGFIGLGNLGRHLAARLLGAGLPLTVYDLDPVAAAGVVAAGARQADSPRAVAEASDCVITCLPSPQAVRAVVAAAGGVLEGLRRAEPDRHEHERPARVERLSLALAGARGVATLSARSRAASTWPRPARSPSSRAVTKPVRGPSVCSRPWADGHPRRAAGRPGDRAVIRNMLAPTPAVARRSCWRSAAASCRDGLRVIHASSGTSFARDREPGDPERPYDIGFTLDLALKDLGFALDLGRELGVPLELAEQVERAFVRAREQYGGSAWSSQVVKLIEDAVGDDLRAPGFPARL
jgi:3-hydroxyisobutyrate dehydrogenase